LPPYRLEERLVVGITSRALFGLDEANAVFEASGLTDYRAYQRSREDEPLGPGTALPLVRALLAINRKAEDRLVEVIIISRNDCDSAVRILRSVEAHGLDISRFAFTDGRDPLPYLRPFCCTLFLSADASDVERALGRGFPAAHVLAPPDHLEDDVDEVRIAFDGDAVLFAGDSEAFYQQNGVDKFRQREAQLANDPMSPGPFEPFLLAVRRIQERFPEERSPIRTALVTARDAPAHHRVINTLRAWQVRIDECFFLGGIPKAGVLEVLRPHIYFDDQLDHLVGAQPTTASAHVVPHTAEQLVFPTTNGDATRAR
jgi:5'-nucleotidase